MPITLVLALAMESALWIFVFINFSGLRFKKLHVGGIFLAVLVSALIIFCLLPSDISSFFFNIVLVGIATAAIYLKTKKIAQSIFFAAFSSLILTFTGAVATSATAPFIIWFADFWGRETIRQSIVWDIIWMIVITCLAVAVTQLSGKAYRKYIAKINEAARQTFHIYLAVCTVVTLLSLLAAIFLRNFSKNALIEWMLSGAFIVFAFFAVLCFAIFAFIR